ncbi:hypothetical protein ACQ4PT_007196 [Festuca glaucescens]
MHPASLSMKVLRGTVLGAAAPGPPAPAPATIAVVVNPIEEEVDEDILFFESEIDLQQYMKEKKEPVAAGVAPLQQPVAEVPEGSCFFAGNDGEDVEQKKVADVVDMEGPPDDASTSTKRDCSSYLGPQDPGYYSSDAEKKVADVVGVEGPPSHSSTSKKRDCISYLDPEDPGYYPVDVEYDSGDSVGEDNEALFSKNIHTKLEQGVLMVGGVMKGTKEWFTYPFCPMKPKDGIKSSLAHHATTLSMFGSTMKDRVKHKVLSDIMCGENKPNVLRRGGKKKGKKAKKY